MEKENRFSEVAIEEKKINFFWQAIDGMFLVQWNVRHWKNIWFKKKKDSFAINYIFSFNQIYIYFTRAQRIKIDRKI